MMTHLNLSLYKNKIGENRINLNGAKILSKLDMPDLT
jgi:hypothetical protein